MPRRCCFLLLPGYELWAVSDEQRSDGFVVGESMGVDSRLALKFFAGKVGSQLLRSRVRFAMERWMKTMIAVR